MLDREKVINGLKELHGSKETMELISEAIALLKEQETIFLKDGHHVRCTNCGEYWCDSDREGNPFPMDFCPHCGKAAKCNE